MIIDCHAHVAAEGVLPTTFFKVWAENISRNLPSNFVDDLRQVIQGNDDPDCTKLLAEMDAAGIDKTVLLIIDFGLGFAEEIIPLEALYLRHRELLQAHPERLLVFAGIDPRRG